MNGNIQIYTKMIKIEWLYPKLCDAIWRKSSHQMSCFCWNYKLLRQINLRKRHLFTLVTFMNLKVTLKPKSDNDICYLLFLEVFSKFG